MEQKQEVMLQDAFATAQGFELLQRVGKMYASATVIPKDYQNNLGNCMIAVEMAGRMHISPIMVMQNLYIVNGRPAWSSQYIIAMINQSKRYTTPLQFEMTGKGESLACYAWAEDHNGHKDIGPEITMTMAKAEGWVDRNGSKWKTMPEVMIRYRAASFFGRMYCSDLLMGIYSRDEVIELEEGDDGVWVSPAHVADEEQNTEELPFAEEPSDSLEPDF